MNQDKVIEIVFSCKEFHIIQDLHDRYYKLWLGKTIPITYKSFKLLILEAYNHVWELNVKMSDFEFNIKYECVYIGEHNSIVDSFHFHYRYNVLSMIKKYE